MWYGVATISRLFKNIGLFCKRALLKRLCSAKETDNFKEPTNCSQPMVLIDAGWETNLVATNTHEKYKMMKDKYYHFSGSWLPLEWFVATTT